MAYFEKACEYLKSEQSNKVEQYGYHAEMVATNWFIKQKLNYIHNNPVKDNVAIL